MAKIVLQQDGKSFTIITNKLSRFWLPFKPDGKDKKIIYIKRL